MAKKHKAKKVLFFIEGAVATEAEEAEALEMLGQGLNVMYRNASKYNEGEALEAFDVVAGNHVPQRYADAFEAKIKAAFNGADPAKFDHDGDKQPGGSKKKSPQEKKADRQAEKDARKAAPAADDPAKAGAVQALSGGAAPSPSPTATAAPGGFAPAPGAAPAPNAPPPPENPPGWTPNA